MSSKHTRKHHPYCLNCHYPLSEFDKNCSQCGQKPTDGKVTMHDLIHEFIHTLFHLDGKFFTTLKHLFVPAKLTLEFFKGHHKRYAHPVQLFLVVGALAFAMILSQAKSIEEKTEYQMAKLQKSATRNKFLVELDSVSRSLASKTGQEANTLRDSLIFKMKYPSGFVKTDYEIEKALQRLVDEKYKNKSNRDIKIDEENDRNKLFRVRFNSDSFQNIRDSLIDIVMSEDVKRIDSLEKVRFDSLERQPKSISGDFMEGFKEGMEKGTIEEMKVTLRQKHRELKTQSDLKEAIKIEVDSFDLFSVMNLTNNRKPVRIPLMEVYELTPDEILKKYNITDFYQKIEAKQAIKSRKNATNLVHFILSKLFLMTFLLIPILSLFFILLYRRQKRYYVEHFVFFLHVNTTLFLGLAACIALYNIIAKDAIFPYYILAAALFVFLSMKFYYQQGWIKTLVKFFMTSTFYLIFACIFFLLISIIGFFLF